jgi:hypothetical protein
MRQPLAQVALVDAGCGGELVYHHRAAVMQRLVETESVTDADQRDACRAAEVRQHLSDELM